MPIPYFSRSYMALHPGANVTIDIVESTGEDVWDVTINSTSTSGGVDIEDDTTPVTTGTTIDFGDGLDVTNDGSGHVTVDATAGTAVSDHLSDAGDAHDASAISVADAGNNYTATDVETALAEVHDLAETIAASVATLEGLDFLVGTATGALSAEIAVGATPGGELGNTWASPTVDATHSGSTHAGAAAAETADIRAADVLVGTSTSAYSGEIVVGTAPGGELGGTWGSPTVDATHSGSTHTAATTTHEAAADPHTGYVLESLFDAKGDIITASADNTPAKTTVGANDTILMADSSAGGGVKWVASAAPSAVSTAAVEGTADTYTRGDHVHAHEAAHINHDTTWAAQGDLIVGTANDTAAVVTKGATGTFLRASATTAAWEAIPFSVGAMLEGAPPANGFRMVWRAPFACTVVNVYTHFDAGTNIVCNARVNQTSDFMSADFTNSTANAWSAGTVNQNQAIAAGDDIEVELVSTSGAVTKANIQVELTRP